MTHLSPLFPLGWHHYLIGGLFVGLGTALLFVLTGRIGGMNSVFSTPWSDLVKRPFFQQARFMDSCHWRLVYAAGLVLGALVRWCGGWGLCGGCASARPLQGWVQVTGAFCGH